MYDEDGARMVNKIFEKATVNNVKIHLPVDFVTGDIFEIEKNRRNNIFAQDTKVGYSKAESGIPDLHVVRICFFSLIISN